MHLKSLTLKGFKSFAQATVFSFEPGITCVVGPNGSGKSNVVDALAWVMGEQGPKTLRGGKMEDVIFAGTATKGPLGRAEVSLTIDNGDGALPIEYSEVTITRTLFRSGGSEYAINGEPCRLLDVQELLSDSGLGREMHVIVGQNQLDGVLRASAEERRGFIEEAAGILKHRRRKEKTERKLEAMQINLTRLQDLAAEVRRQLKPLGQQAEVARKAQGVAAVLRDAKSRLLAADVAELVHRVELGSSSEAERRAERSIIQELLSEQQSRLTQLEGAGLSLELDRARRLDFEFDSSADRTRSLLVLTSQRLAMLENQEQLDARFDTGALTEQLAQAELEAAALTEQNAEARVHLEQAVARREVARGELDALDAAIAQQNSLVSDFDLELARLAGEMALAEARLESQLQEQGRRTSSREEALARRDSLQGDYETLERQLERSEDTGPRRTFEEAQSNLDALERRLEEIRDELHELERERDAAAAEHATLNLTLEQKDGTSAVLARQSKGVLGLVAKQVKIASGYEAAVAAALGSLSDAILVASLEAGLEVLENARGDQLGQVEILVDGASPSLDHPDLEAALLASGATSLGSQVSGSSALLAQLAGFLVVEDLDAVRGFASQILKSGMKVVTRSGDLVTANQLRGGSGARASKLELVAQRDAAQQRMVALENKIGGVQGEQAKLRAQAQAGRESSAKALAAIKALDAELAERAEALGRTRAQLEASQAELSRLEEAEARGSVAVEEARGELTSAIERHDEMAGRERPQLLSGDRVALEANLEQERAAELQLRIELGAAEERQRVALSRVSELSERLIEAKSELERQQLAIRRRDWQLAQAKLVLGALPELLDAIAHGGAIAKTAVSEQERERSQSQQELIRLRGEVSELQERMSRLTQGVHDLELENHEARLRLGNLLQRAHDELSLDQETLLSEYGPDQPVPVPSDEDPEASRAFDRTLEERRLADAERMLERLGRVNPLALEEFAALEQRHQFLTEQLEDLTQTRKDLIQIIRDLDEKMQHIFAAAFEDTQRAFAEVFPKLFPGGSGSIELTNPDDLLTTGIEMTVKPAGKRIDRLSLLSGGERSLAAVAWLIAIFKARPSPFYVLDEVEAALDDANLGRLLHLIEELRRDSQLILVTHQKRTMEIADALYGVSMRSDGVSAVVSQRMSEKAS